MHRDTIQQRKFDEFCADLYNGGVKAFAQINHARFHDPSMIYHVVSKVMQGRFLLRPELRWRQRSLILGVIGRALHLYKSVKLYAKAFMSNHIHLMVQGDAESLPRFIGFIKREISRRWGEVVNWSGPMWEEYYSAALPTEEAQFACYKYILSHGVKEKLVDEPQKWPGVHSARALFTGVQQVGRWLNATAYGRARRKEQEKKKPCRISRDGFITKYPVTLSRLPAWENLNHREHQVRIHKLLAEIVEAGRCARAGKRPLGLKRVVSQSRHKRGAAPRPPWFTERRRMIVWGGLTSEAARIYSDVYWAFQRAFRLASDKLLAGRLDVEFPAGAFRPGLHQVACTE